MPAAGCASCVLRVCLVCAQKDADKGRKIRVIVVSEDLLGRCQSMPTPILEDQSHAVRWALIQLMAKRFENPDAADSMLPAVLWRFEMALPVPAIESHAAHDNTTQ